MNVVKKRLVANEQVERDERFWNSTGDEFEYGILNGVESKDLQHLQEGNENLCDTCVYDPSDCPAFISMNFGHDDKGEPIVVTCPDYEPQK